MISGCAMKMIFPFGNVVMLGFSPQPTRSSSADMAFMRRLEDIGSPQRSSQIIPVGKQPIWFDKTTGAK